MVATASAIHFAGATPIPVDCGPDHLIDPRAVQVLESLMAQQWVIIHPYLTLNTTNLLAFHPVRDPARVIRINPILCRWMNTDFDGDQVAVQLAGDWCEKAADNRYSRHSPVNRRLQQNKSCGPYLQTGLRAGS